MGNHLVAKLNPARGDWKRPSGRRRTHRTFTTPLTLEQKSSVLQAVSKCWNPSKKLLALANFIPTNNQNSDWLTFDNDKFVEHLVDILQSKCSEVEAIDLSSNNIKTFFAFKSFKRGAPNLRCLSITNNPFADFRELDHLLCFRDQLTEIKICSDQLKKKAGHDFLYQEEILTRFPNLLLLDGSTIVPAVEFPQPLPKSLLPDPPKSSCLPAQDQFKFICQQFLPTFLQAIDKDRSRIPKFYAKNAVFSCTLHQDPVESGAPKATSTNTLMKHNRNIHLKYNATNKLYIGPQNIMNFYADLPQCKHQTDLLVVDSSPVPSSGLFQLSLSGFFLESNGGTGVLRKFHRLLTIIPASNEMQVSILNDQWNFNSCYDPEKGVSLPGSQQTSNMNVIRQLKNHTNVKLSVAIQAMQQANYDPQNALKVIQALNQNKVNLFG